MGQRLSTLLGWIEELAASGALGIEEGWELLPVSGDASFRRYFRVKSASRSWIAVDAPPEKENSDVFVRIAKEWKAQEINVPNVISADLEQGLMLLSDFGDRLYLPELTAHSVDKLYQLALAELFRIQQCNADSLPVYDSALLQREMTLFPEWFLGSLLKIDLNPQELACIHAAFLLLEQSALAQPVVCVHRDYHSRNLMITSEKTPGVIDFQDAVKGPVTYDLASLLRDCYISWPDADVYAWVESFRVSLIEQDVISLEVTSDCFKRWFDLMGMQRHLKAIGIFARLSIRDDKHAYLQDIPRTLNYVRDVAAKYPELSGFRQLLEERIVAAMSESHYFPDETL
jgi:aminoglycoside/choline kinase family phosphotransferase